ncbi:ATP-binding protein [Prevotella sp. LCP21S3_D2]|jgi:predicted AAA+ superfamily ATPase|uniref:ATP-binding protein n=1 Tax=Prevotella sp. LCP21S3_D2 TaxID=3438800 RepID=UPI003F97E918
MRIFKRKLYDKLLDWKTNRKGKTAVMIEGARRVGKSTLAKQFAENEYESYVLIDFSIASKDIIKLFDYINDLEYFFMQLQFRLGVSLIEHKSLIIFDEVQKCPKARQAIKHLVADGRYDYIQTGSLISIHKNVKDIVIPSEEEKMILNPMDYEEFKWAQDDTVSYPQLKILFDKKIAIGDAVTRKLMRDFRIYMVVGGMPQAVSEYIDSHNLQEVDRVKRSIIQLYEDDFYKIDPSGRISSLFDAIPAQLNSNASRYQTASVIGDNAGTEKVLQLISELRESRTINMAYHANDPGVGMSLSMDVSKYKMYVADTGLFITLAFKDKDFTENIIYQKLMSDKLDANLGYVYENMVAQMLTAAGNRLFYYTFPTETGKHNYEIDFLLSRGNKICPIEVKSSGYKRHASLDAFCQKFSNRVLQRYLIYTKDLQKDEQTLFLPVYLTQFL